MTESTNPPYVKEFLPESKIVIKGALFERSDSAKRKRREQPAERAHGVLRPVLIVAQCIALLPFEGVLGADHTYIRYRKYSPKVVVSVILIFIESCFVFLTIMQVVVEEFSYRVAGDVMFYFTCCLSMIAFHKLANKWKTLMARWASVEDAMTGFPPVSVARPIFCLTIYVAVASICEHTLAVLYNRDPCYTGSEKYYQEAFRQVFRLTEYALWKGLIASLINFIMASTWNFTDLFLAAVSIALAARFQQFNLELDSVMHKNMDATYWKKMREIYNKLAILTKLLDENISILVLISFTNNLYFICLQLLHSIEPVQSIPKMIYSLVSFGHLLFRACSVCLTAADVYDKSKAPLTTLFSVPSSSWNVEVRRLVLQVSHENLALTGCNFFSVTRTLLLTVAGTIATYEIVLVQFSNISPDDRQSRVLNCSLGTH